MNRSCRTANAALRVFSTWSVVAALVVAGCTTSSDGLDLSEVGVLSLVISRDGDASAATATAQVTQDNLVGSKIMLGDDQVLFVNDVALTPTPRTLLGLDAVVSANVSAKSAPKTYTIRFENQGATSSYEATPPVKLEDVLPEENTEVPRDGFTLMWDAPNSGSTAVDIVISGSALSLADNGTTQVIDYAVTLTDIADDGSHDITLADLNLFLEGPIVVSITRVKTISQKLGFASGTIELSITHDLPLTLVDSES